MNSLATLLSVAVLIGVTSCMSLQEYEEAEESGRNLGWLHFHFHFHELEDGAVSEAKCVGNKCSLCAKSNYQVNIKDVVSLTFPFDGCIVVSQEKNGYGFELQMEGKKVYKNTYEINTFDVLPCVHASKYPKDAEVCPEIYNVSEQKGTMCIRINENLEVKTTALKHRVELGCFKVPK